MSYTPPTGNAVNFQQTGVAYTPPAGNAVAFQFSAAGTASAVGTSPGQGAVSGAGDAVGVRSGAGSSAGQGTVSAVSVVIASGVGSSAGQGAASAVGVSTGIILQDLFGGSGSISGRDYTSDVGAGTWDSSDSTITGGYAVPTGGSSQQYTNFNADPMPTADPAYTQAELVFTVKAQSTGSLNSQEVKADFGWQNGDWSQYSEILVDWGVANFGTYANSYTITFSFWDEGGTNVSDFITISGQSLFVADSTHVVKIKTTDSSVDLYIDDSLVHSHAFPSGFAMRGAVNFLYGLMSRLDVDSITVTGISSGTGGTTGDVVAGVGSAAGQATVAATSQPAGVVSARAICPSLYALARASGDGAAVTPSVATAEGSSQVDGSPVSAPVASAAGASAVAGAGAAIRAARGSSIASADVAGDFASIVAGAGGILASSFSGGVSGTIRFVFAEGSSAGSSSVRGDPLPPYDIYADVTYVYTKHSEVVCRNP